MSRSSGDEIEIPRTIQSSEDIIADLLNDVKASDKPFSVDKLAGCIETDLPEKKKKSKKHHHKHKTKKKKRKDDKRRSRSRSRSRGRSRSRSRSPRRKRNSRKRDRSDDKEEPSGSKSDHKTEIENEPSTSKSDEQSELKQPNRQSNIEEDDLPLGADFRTPIVQKDQKMSINITTVIPKPDEEAQPSENASPKEQVEEENIVDVETTNEAQMPSDWVKVDKENKKEKKKESKSKKKRRCRSRSDSPKRRKTSKVTKTSRRRSRSYSRSRSPKRRDLGRSRRDERSRSREYRRRSRSNEQRRIRRREYDDYKRDRSRSREKVDKERLLAIAKAKRAQMLSAGDRDNASREDFVTMCIRVQRRQERENRRKRGEAVSDHESDNEVIQVKHPYAMPKDQIRINIVTETTYALAQKALPAPEETSLDSTQLRIVFPVSSGAVHKENTEWTPVIKENVPKSCTNEQKKHVALTSYEIERCKTQGIPVPPVQTPAFLTTILPPPPPPPRFAPNPNDYLAPPSPPPLPCVLYVPPKENMILKEPCQVQMPAPNDIGDTLKLRAQAQKRLYEAPNDFDAHRQLKEANLKIDSWALLKSLPGEYTGTTGLKLLTPEELQPRDPKYNAWVKRDQFKNAAPATGGLGMKLLEKMGWKMGEGLGKDATGNVEPLVLDVKSDRRGLMAEEEMTVRQRNKLNAQNNVPADLSGKNPISLIMEFCAKRKWQNPIFNCEESGRDHLKSFIWTVTVNGVEYRPMVGSKQKKEGKTVAAQVALQAMGILPRETPYS